MLTEALKSISILGEDVHTKFLKVASREKHYLRSGTEFGPLKGKIFIFNR